MPAKHPDTPGNYIGPENQISLRDIARIADRATKMLVDVKSTMLSPLTEKTPPTFTTARLATLCNADGKKINYYLNSRKDLPQGISSGRGKSREFTLEETRTWVKLVANFPSRPPGKKGKKIAIGNFKGGVTKTTMTMALGQALSLKGLRVLLVDLDPQASLSTLAGILVHSEMPSIDNTILPYIYGDQPDLSYCIQKTYWDGIDLIPTNSTLTHADFYLPMKQSQSKKEDHFKFWDVLNKGLEPYLDEYDVILIDTPPALSYITLNAFMAADSLIVPIPPSFLDYASSAQFWFLFSDLASSLYELTSDFDKNYDFINVVMTKVDNSKATTSTISDWIKKTYLDLVLHLDIPDTNVAANASTIFGTAYDIKKYSWNPKTYERAIDAYDKFAEAIFQQLIASWNRG